MASQLAAESQGEHQGPRSPEALPVGRAKPAPEVSPVRVMVVDDVAAVRELLRDYLESEGYTVEAVGDARDALLRLSEFRPHVMLLDILMPGLSGITALEQIRASHPEVEVIMVTGVGDEAIARRALALGAFDYVTKPIDFAYLTWALETCLLMWPLLPDIDGKAGETKG